MASPSLWKPGDHKMDLKKVIYTLDMRLSLCTRFRWGAFSRVVTVKISS